MSWERGWRAGDASGGTEGEANEKTLNGIKAPRKTILSEGLQMGPRSPSRELASAPSRRSGNLGTLGGWVG